MTRAELTRVMDRLDRICVALERIADSLAERSPDHGKEPDR